MRLQTYKFALTHQHYYSLLCSWHWLTLSCRSLANSLSWASIAIILSLSIWSIPSPFFLSSCSCSNLASSWINNIVFQFYTFYDGSYQWKQPSVINVYAISQTQFSKSFWSIPLLPSPYHTVGNTKHLLWKIMTIVRRCSLHYSRILIVRTFVFQTPSC